MNQLASVRAYLSLCAAAIAIAQNPHLSSVLSQGPPSGTSTPSSVTSTGNHDFLRSVYKFRTCILPFYNGKIIGE